MKTAETLGRVKTLFEEANVKGSIYCRVQDGIIHSQMGGCAREVDSTHLDISKAASGDLCPRCTTSLELNGVRIYHWDDTEVSLRKAQKLVGTPIESFEDLAWRFSCPDFPGEMSKHALYAFGETLRAEIYRGINLRNISKETLEELHLRLVKEVIETPKALKGNEGEDSFMSWVKSYAQTLDSDPQWYLITWQAGRPWSLSEGLVRKLYGWDIPRQPSVFLVPSSVKLWAVNQPERVPHSGRKVLEFDRPLTAADAEAFRVLFDPDGTGPYTDAKATMEAVINL